MFNDCPQLIKIARAIGNQPDYFQGGGGNLSFKTDANTMVIKASGYRVSDMNATTGLAAVNYPPIRNFYEKQASHLDIETLIAENKKLVLENTISDNANLPSRPSMEVGFHAIGGPCVIHSHSVYANILNCSFEGKEIITELFPKAINIPYHTPGAPLTVSIQKQLNTDSHIIFLENHGLIVWAETAEHALELHEQVTMQIKKRFGITEPFPIVAVRKNEADCFLSDTPWISAFLQKSPERVAAMHNTVLFPDQAIYQDSVNFRDDISSPITINGALGLIHYTGQKNEALAFEEIFAAWAFLLTQIEKNGLTLRTLTNSDSAAVNNLESEKYRKKMIASL